jgi:osmotically inducible protein OsmC
MKAIGSASWTGGWRNGEGTISTESGSVKAATYSFASRFTEDEGVSPEELLAAAHASCFNQALANNLDQENLQAELMQTTVEVQYGFTDAGRPIIDGVHISVEAKVPHASAEQFEKRVAAAARGCTISRILTFEPTFEALLR